jgi:hypothetical protein
MVICTLMHAYCHRRMRSASIIRPPCTAQSGAARCRTRMFPRGGFPHSDGAGRLLALQSTP